MNAEEAGRILYVLSTVDNREVDAGRARGYALALRNIPYEVGQLAVEQALQAADVDYIDAKVLIRYATPIMRRNARDAKSARLRGWLPPDWPDTKLVPPAIGQRIRAEYLATNNRPDEISEGGPAVDIGEIGRRVPDDGDAA